MMGSVLNNLAVLMHYKLHQESKYVLLVGIIFTLFINLYHNRVFVTLDIFKQ